MKDNILLVCVIDQNDGERIIKEGYRLAAKEKLKLKVLNIQKEEVSRNIKGTGLEDLFAKCSFLKIDMQVYWGKDSSEVAINFIRRNRPDALLLSKCSCSDKEEFISNLHRTFPDIPITIM